MRILYKTDLFACTSGVDVNFNISSVTTFQNRIMHTVFVHELLRMPHAESTLSLHDSKERFKHPTGKTNNAQACT